MTSKPPSTWGTFEEFDEYDNVSAVAIVPMLEHENHHKFMITCGCGVKVEFVNDTPMFVHQEVRN